MVKSFQMSSQQKQYWLHRKNLPATAQVSIKLIGSLDIERLNHVFDQIVQRYEILRTDLKVVNEMTIPLQVINDKVTVKREVYDFTHISADELSAVIEETLSSYTAKLNSQSDIGISSLLIWINSRQNLLIVNFPSYQMDQESMDLFVRELAADYNNVQETKFDAIQYVEVSEWANSLLDSEVAPEGQAYWKRAAIIDGYNTQLPIMHANSQQEYSEYHKHETAKLSSDCFNRLSALAKEYSVTESQICLAIWQVLLYRIDKRSNIVMGTSFNGRSEDDLKGVYGALSKYLPLNTAISDEDNLEDILKRNKQQIDDIFCWQECFSWDLHKEAIDEKDRFYSYCFQFDAGSVAVGMGELQFIIEDRFVCNDRFIIKLVCHCNELAKEVSFSFIYDNKRLASSAINRLAEQYNSLLTNWLENSQKNLGQLQILPENQRDEILYKFNNTQRDYPKDQCIHHYIEKQCILTPDAIAVEDVDKSITYRELNTKAEQLAYQLIKNNIATGDFVGVYVNRTVEVIIAIVGIFKAGGVYVPLDPSYPKKRLDYILEDSQTKMILSVESFGNRFDHRDVNLIFLDEILDAEENTTNKTFVEPDNNAYLIYTSGSTGKPKGTLVPHKSLLNHCFGVKEHYELNKDDRTLLFAPLNFDPSLEQSLPTLLAGGTVVLRSDDLWSPAETAQRIKKLNLSVVNFPTPFWQLLVNEWEQLCPEFSTDKLRLMIVGGDKINAETMKSWLKLPLAHIRLLNAYGPTEATVTATIGENFENALKDYNTVPIGKSLPNRKAYVLDDNYQPVPINTTGELYLAGDCLASEYLNHNKLTKEKFLKDPFSNNSSARMYRTGDRAAFSEQGDLYFFGRDDSQVKIRGFRVELGEIEQVLLQAEEVIEAAVVFTSIDESCSDNNKQIVAFVVAANNNTGLETKLHEQLQEKLPEYMVPSIIECIDEIPKMPNGKHDRKALTELSISNSRYEDEDLYEAPQTPTETSLAEIWQELFTVDRIGRKHNFHALGGHSLLAMRLVNSIRQHFSVDISLQAIFESIELSDMARTIDGLAEKTVISRPPIERTARDKPIPLSFSQERLWFLAKLGFSEQYHLTGMLEIKGRLNEAMLEESFNLIISRHESLRTEFVEDSNGLRQNILDSLTIRIEKKNFETFSDTDTAPNVKATIEEWVGRPFNIEKAPLIRVIALQLDVDNCIVAFCIHHIIADGWSINLLVKELQEAYSALTRGDSPELGPVSFQFADYAVWQRQLIKGDMEAREMAYWHKQLDGYQNLDIPTDFPRPKKLSGKGANVKFKLSSSLISRLSQRCEEYGVTIFVPLISAVYILLQRYSNQSNFCLGIPVANRDEKDSEGIVGLMVNTLAARLETQKNDLKIAEFFKHVQNIIANMQDHQHLPFEKIVESLAKERDLSRNPVFQVLVNYNAPDLQLSRLVVEQLEQFHIDLAVAKLDLLFDFVIDDEGGICVLEYSKDLFKESTILQLADGLSNLIQQFADLSDVMLQKIELLSKFKKKRLLSAACGREVSVSEDSRLDLSVLQLFVQQLKNTPDKTAVMCNDYALSYAELDEQSNRLSVYLQEKGLKKNQFVGICLNRSPNIVLAFLAVMKSGCAYIPLDPDHPNSRLQTIVNDSGLSFVISNAELQDKLIDSGVPSAKIVALDTKWSEIESYSCNDISVAPIDLKQLAHVIYTSGSTGTPKGVKISHGALTNLLLSVARQPGMSKDDLLLAISNYCFDIAGLELLLPIIVGGSCYISDSKTVKNGELLISEIKRIKPTIMQATPATWWMLFELGWGNEEGVVLISGGEAISENLKRHFDRTNSIVWNGYGPTESTIYTTFARLEKNATPSIGTPIDNINVYVLNDDMHLCPIGVPGQLYIGGKGLAEGYLNLPGLTEEYFIPNPFDSNSKLYRTGDLVKWLADANGKPKTLDYIGRVDTQVKLRGFRIELSEIENFLGQQQEIKEAIVVMNQQNDLNRLIAYFVPAEPIIKIDVNKLRQALLEKLPSYMLPALFIELEEIPLSPNGKADRRALASRTVDSMAVKAKNLLPETQVEHKLAQLWSQLLDVTEIGLDDNFFLLGGHSLLLVKLQSRIVSQFNIKIALDTLFENATLSQMAAVIENKNVASAVLLDIDPVTTPETPPLSYSQEGLWLLTQLGHNPSAFNMPAALSLKGDIDIDCLLTCLKHLEKRHQVLRTTFDFVDGKTIQIIHKKSLTDFKSENLSPNDKNNFEKRLATVMEEESRRIFDLKSGPLWHVRLLNIAADELIVIFNIHHICVDGWSMNILIDEMKSLYVSEKEGMQASLQDLPLQYGDYAYWQRTKLKDREYKNSLDYWENQLKDCPDLCSIPTDHPYPEVQSYSGASEKIILDAKFCEKLQNFSNEQNVTLFMLMMTVFKTLLYFESGRKDQIVGTDVANRNNEDIEHIVGFFVNQLALRSQIHPEYSLTEQLAVIKHSTIGSFAHQSLPFDRLVDHLAVSRNLNYAPLFQIKMFLLASPEPVQTFSDITMEIKSPDVYSARHDLTLGLFQTSAGITADFIFNKDIFDRKRIERLANQFQDMLKFWMKQPNLKINELASQLKISNKDENFISNKLKTFQRGSGRKSIERKPIAGGVNSVFNKGRVFEEHSLPFVYETQNKEPCLHEWLAENKEQWSADLLKHGAILFRGFGIDIVQEMERVAEATIDKIYLNNAEHQPLKNSASVQVPVNYAKDQKLLWHNENTFNLSWPSKAIFACAKPAIKGGETPLVDSRQLFNRIDPSVREEFSQKGVMYVRNYSANDYVGLSWKKIFGEDRKEVEKYLKANGFEYEWKTDDRLVTSAKRPAVWQHLLTDEWCWINQAQHWHFSCLSAETQSSIRQLFDEKDYPRNCYFGDGSRISDDTIQHILDLYGELEVAFPWQQGDVVLVDNCLAAHARNAYEGERRILVCFGDVITYGDIT